MDEVHFRGDFINLLGIPGVQLKYFSSLVDVQSHIGAVLLKIGLSHCFIRFS